MTIEQQTFLDASGYLSGALVHDAPDETIQKFYNELVAAHQAWWESTETWKAINEENRDQHEP